MTTDEAIALGLVKVQKIPPAYVGVVRGATPLPQTWVDHPLERKQWAASRARSRAKLTGRGWRGKVAMALAETPGLTAKQIAATCPRSDKPDHKWIMSILSALRREGVVIRSAGKEPTWKLAAQ